MPVSLAEAAQRTGLQLCAQETEFGAIKVRLADESARDDPVQQKR